MFKNIVHELREHTPFTIFGAVSGIILMVLCSRLPFHLAYNIFYVLHPAHIIFSALVTASMYELYKRGRLKGKCNLGVLLLIGYFGSVGVATLSDSIIPYLAEVLLQMPNRQAHIGFLEEWWLVNPLAVIGIGIAYFRPSTKFPHAAHVLVSTWASLFHIIMAMGGNAHPGSFIIVFIFLFLAVWVPCCFSDIVFPLLFVARETKKR